MTGNRIVTKQQAGDEDLLLGEGQVTQVRNGVPVTVTKQRRVQPVLSQAELDALDTNKYKTALLIDNGTFSLKRATAGGWVTVPAKDYDVAAVTAAVQAALDQSTADAAGYAAVAQSEQVSATASANSAANSALAAAGSASSASASASAAASSALAASQDADDADTARLAAEAAAAAAAQHVIDSGVNADDAHDAATLALAHRDNAEAQADLAVSAYRNFRAHWYGASATEPTLDPYGEPMTIGDLYFNSTNNFTYVFNGMVWQVASIPPDLIPYMESVRDEVVLLEQQAEASAIAAADSATAAAGSAATAVANANNSQLSANNSASSATAAANSATAAAGSASAASQDADDAEAARIAAQASALAAANSETAAANSETAAANSETAAANSATAAANSATAASNSQIVVEAAEQDYRGSWYGPLASAPTQDPFGNPVEEGDAYYDTTDKLLKVYDGTTWTLGTVPPGTLGTAATKDVATEAEALAGTAGVLVTAGQARAVIAQDAPSKTGTGASGTWDVGITGNAASATKLQTARTIGGVSFDGTANINLPGVNTAGNQNTSGTAAQATLLQVTDNRIIKPSGTSARALSSYFVSQGGLTGPTSNTQYGDLLVLNGYSDVSGGAITGLFFSKLSKSILYYQAALGATSWGAPHELLHTGNASSGRNLQLVWSGNTASIDLDNLSGGHPGAGEYLIEAYGGTFNLHIRPGVSCVNCCNTSISGSQLLTTRIRHTSANVLSVDEMGISGTNAVTGAVSMSKIYKVV